MIGAGPVDHLPDHLENLHPDGAAALDGGRLLQIANGLAEQVGRKFEAAGLGSRQGFALDSYVGTVVAVTHDRWFLRGFDRFVVFGRDATVTEHLEPVFV